MSGIGTIVVLVQVGRDRRVLATTKEIKFHQVEQHNWPPVSFGISFHSMDAGDAVEEDPTSSYELPVEQQRICLESSKATKQSKVAPSPPANATTAVTNSTMQIRPQIA